MPSKWRFKKGDKVLMNNCEFTITACTSFHADAFYELKELPGSFAEYLFKHCALEQQ